MRCVEVVYLLKLSQPRPSKLSMDGPWPAERYKKVLDIQL